MPKITETILCPGKGRCGTLPSDRGTFSSPTLTAWQIWPHRRHEGTNCINIGPIVAPPDPFALLPPRTSSARRKRPSDRRTPSYRMQTAWRLWWRHLWATHALINATALSAALSTASSVVLSTTTVSPRSAWHRVASDCGAISGDRHHGLPRPDPLVVVGNMRRCQELEDAMVPSVVQVDNLNLRFKF